MSCPSQIGTAVRMRTGCDLMSLPPMDTDDQGKSLATDGAPMNTDEEEGIHLPQMGHRWAPIKAKANPSLSSVFICAPSVAKSVLSSLHRCSSLPHRWLKSVRLGAEVSARGGDFVLTVTWAGSKVPDARFFGPFSHRWWQSCLPTLRDVCGRSSCSPRSRSRLSVVAPARA